MKNIKIAFFDIDGTLVNFHAGKMTECVRDTLIRLKENGVRICISTGRGPTFLPDLSDIEFDAYLTFNGQYCFAGEHVIHSNPLSKKDVRTITDNCAAIGRAVSAATANELIADGMDDDLRTYYSFSKLELIADPNFERVENEDVYQVMMGCTREDYPAIIKGTDNAKIVGWWEHAADVIPGDGGKGTGVRKTLEYFGLKKEEAIAFGDGNNDIEMLEAVGTGVAMGNASAYLKAVADEICEPVSEDGVYQYCLKNGLIREN